jgi:3',5'-cyclic AMP phosphodiesterase CpdA
MRVLHFSDIHIGMHLREVPLRKWLGKRALGALNLLAGRGRHFLANPSKLEALAQFSRRHGIDLVVFTGDYTALGLEPELEAARLAVEPLMQAPLGYVNIPGNHDFYLFDVLREGWFEHHFGDTLESDLPEYRRDGPWPLVRLVGEEVAVVGVNTARPNPLLWRSSGRLPDAQLNALRELLSDPRVRERYVFVLCHYPPRLHDGRRDHPRHRMVNDNEFLDACADIPRGAILSGHVHHRYAVRVDNVNPPIFCSGSTTMRSREGLWVFDVDRAAVRATPGRWDGRDYVLLHDAAIDDDRRAV